jgi:hypothetical protein
MESPDKYVIKVYTTEANARADTSSLMVDDRDTGGILSTAQSGWVITGRYPLTIEVLTNQYFVGFRKYWYRFEFSEPVAAFYVDWDDGEDNSKEKSNSQVVALDAPNTFGVVSHIYTKAGKFFPLVRGIGTDGFWSKYYSSNNSSNSFAELEETTLTAGQNENSIVSLDLKNNSNSNVRIPYFYSTTLPPVGILKVDRKTVYSGIDNEAVHINYITRGGPSTVYAWFSGEANTPSVHKKVEVDVTYETISGEIKKTTIHTQHQNSEIDATENVAIGDVWKIVDVELTKATEHTTKADNSSVLLHPQERVYLRWSNTASAQDIGNEKITGETAPSASLTNKVFIKSPSHSATEGATVLLTGTTNFNGRFTVQEDFAISGFTDNGATVTITSGTDLGIPAGEVITLTGSGDLNGDFTVTSVTDKNNIVITTATAPPGGGSPRFSTKNGFFAVGASNAADEGTKGAWGLINTAGDRAVCNVSTGWPKLTLNQRGFFVTADLSESRTRAPNLSISETAGNLLLDDGKQDWGTQTTDKPRATDTMDHSTTDDGGNTYYINRLTDFRTQIEYTHDPFVDVDTWAGFRDYIDNRDSDDAERAHTQDGTYRFFDSYRLLRCQVKDDRADVANDKFAYSEIETFGDYSEAGNNGTILPSEVAKEHRLWLTLNNGGTWTEKSSANQNSSSSLGTFAEQALTTGPKNFFLLANSQRKFDRLFFSSRNEFDNDINEQEGGLCRISIFYPAYDARRDEIKFRAIPFEDYTKTIVDDSSLYLNGPVVFEAPDNWVKCAYDDIKNKAGTALWPEGLTSNSNWDFDAYTVLIAVGCEQVSVTDGTSDPPDIATIFPYDNDHSEVIKVTDSMHVSLNSIVIAQSLSFNRKGKYIRVDDRIGRSELRKIGSEGGSIRFGGISFGDYSTAAHTGYDDYELVKRYQQEGTPVYLDLTRPNGEIVRFFGKITSMSEDVPTGRVAEKWAVEMQTEAVAEFNSDGTWLSDGFLSLGGILENEPKYV